MDEAEHLADRVGIVVVGRMIALGTPGEIGGDQGTAAVVSFRLPAGATPSELPDLGAPLTTDGAEWQLRTSTPTAVLSRLTGWGQDRGLELPALTVARPPLEDVYLELVARHDLHRETVRSTEVSS